MGSTQEESEAPGLKELTVWQGKALLSAAGGHSWGRNAGMVWGPGLEMFRSYQKQTGKGAKQGLFTVIPAVYGPKLWLMQDP